MKLSTTIVLVASTALLSSCAPAAWVKQGVTDQRRSADQAQCLQRAQREARDLAWRHRFEAWWLYPFYGDSDYPYHYRPYAWQWGYGPLFSYEDSLDNDTLSLTNFCMRSKGYTLAEGRFSKEGQ